MHHRDLLANYRKAFGAWVSQVARLRAVNKSEPGGDARKLAQANVKVAETAYREARNLMVDDMMIPRGFGQQRRP